MGKKKAKQQPGLSAEESGSESELRAEGPPEGLRADVDEVKSTTDSAVRSFDSAVRSFSEAVDSAVEKLSSRIDSAVEEINSVIDTRFSNVRSTPEPTEEEVSGEGPAGAV